MPLLFCIIIGFFLRPYFSLQPFMAGACGLYLLLSSSEINLRQPTGERTLIFKLWAGAFFLPFVAGLILPFILPNLFRSAVGISPSKTALMLGIALAVSAVPVVIKIMQELGWSGTLRAQRIILTAVLCDMTCWLLFFLVLPASGHTSWLLSHWSLLMFFVGLLIAYLWPTLPQKISWILKLNKWLIAPIFFIGVGQELNLSAESNAGQIILIFVVATVSKTFGVWFAAKQSKLVQEEIFATSIALNSRGAMEIIMAKFALNAGMINSEFFLSLVVMALATSLMIKPIFRWGSIFGLNSILKSNKI